MTNLKHENLDLQLAEKSQYAAADNARDYEFGVLKTIEQLEAIKEQWQTLEQQSSEAFQYFQTYEWCVNWCKTFNSDEAGHNKFPLHVFTLKIDGQFALIWPLMTRRVTFGLRVLTALSHPLAQYSNLIVDRKKIDLDLGQKFWTYVQKTRGIDAIQVSKFPENSFLAEILGKDGYSDTEEQYASYMQLNTYKSWDEVNAALPKSTRRQRNKRRNKLSKIGTVDYQVAIGGSEHYKELVERGVEMKQVWLKERGLFSKALTDDLTPHFLSNLTGSEGTENKPPQGAVANALMLDGEPIGIEIGMLQGAHYYSYLGAFDWDKKDLSPGKIQMEMAQQWAFENKIEKFDLMGDPAAYKSSWTDTDQPLKSSSIAVSMRGACYSLMRSKLRPFLKKMLHSMNGDVRKSIIGFIQKLTVSKRSNAVKQTNATSH